MEGLRVVRQQQNRCSLPAFRQLLVWIAVAGVLLVLFGFRASETIGNPTQLVTIHPQTPEDRIFLSTHGIGEVVNDIFQLIISKNPLNVSDIMGTWIAAALDVESGSAYSLRHQPERQREFVTLLASLVFDPKRPQMADNGAMVRMEMLRAIQPRHAYLPNHSRVAVLVEPRCVPHLERILRQHIAMLSPTHWNLHVWHLPSNEACMDAALSGWATYRKNNISDIVNLRGQGMHVGHYNDLLRSRAFWEHIEGDHVLIFQTDSMLCRTGIEEFTPFSYVGAPWPDGWKESTPHYVGGNGGISLRNRKHSVDCVTHVQPDDVQHYRDAWCEEHSHIPANKTWCAQGTGGLFVIEDMYFSHAMEMRGHLVAPRHMAKKFATETMWGPNPLAVHKFHVISPQECARIMLRDFGIAPEHMDRMIVSSRIIAEQKGLTPSSSLGGDAPNWVPTMR